MCPGDALWFSLASTLHPQISAADSAHLCSSTQPHSAIEAMAALTDNFTWLAFSGTIHFGQGARSLRGHLALSNSRQTGRRSASRMMGKCSTVRPTPTGQSTSRAASGCLRSSSMPLSDVPGPPTRRDGTSRLRRPLRNLQLNGEIATGDIPLTPPAFDSLAIPTLITAFGDGGARCRDRHAGGPPWESSARRWERTRQTNDISFASDCFIREISSIAASEREFGVGSFPTGRKRS